MNTKYLMTASAIVLGLAGIATTFLPQEIAGLIGVEDTGRAILCIQIIGASYFGFAMMNWMARSVLLGGVYSRPLAMGNFSHFMIAGIAFIKRGSIDQNSGYIWLVATIYLLFAILFGIVLFTSPKKEASKA